MKRPARRSPSTPWPTIEEFLQAEEGNLSLGSIDAPGCGYTAIVTDGHNMLVALVRQRRESLHQLLDRLEAALGPAIESQIFVDEINP